MALLEGLIAATYTPMYEDGRLKPEAVPDYVDYLVASGISGLYVCGSTGEGISLSVAERKKTAEAFVAATAGRLPVVIQVGANSLADSRELALHAESIGASAVSANAPGYFKIDTAALLVDCMEQIALAARNTPFYYYHIPRFTGAAVDMIEFLDRAGDRIPNLAGIKYTDLKAFEYMDCLAYDGGRYEILWGCDEMLLAALAVGARGAIGSTYSLTPGCYLNIIRSFEERDFEQSRMWQLRSWHYIKILNRHGNLLAVQKRLLKKLGLDLGPCRLPIPPVGEEVFQRVLVELDRLGFFQWNG